MVYPSLSPPPRALILIASSFDSLGGWPTIPSPKHKVAST